MENLEPERSQIEYPFLASPLKRHVGKHFVLNADNPRVIVWEIKPHVGKRYWMRTTKWSHSPTVYEKRIDTLYQLKKVFRHWFFTEEQAEKFAKESIDDNK